MRVLPLLALAACTGAQTRAPAEEKVTFVQGGAGKLRVSVRHNMVEYDPRPDLAHYTGPRIAIEVQGNDSPLMASNLPGMERRTIPNVSHWLMLDDPAALDRELDAFLAAH